MIDLDKVILATPYNSLKNDSQLYTGSVDFPTSLTAAQQFIGTTTIQLASPPVFSAFFAYFQEFNDLIGPNGNTAQWYGTEICALDSVGLVVTAPPAQAGFISSSIYPIINGSQVDVTVEIFNPYNVTITITALTVPFAFAEYSLAN